MVSISVLTLIFEEQNIILLPNDTSNLINPVRLVSRNVCHYHRPREDLY